MNKDTEISEKNYVDMDDHEIEKHTEAWKHHNRETARLKFLNSEHFQNINTARFKH